MIQRMSENNDIVNRKSRTATSERWFLWC